MNTTPALTAVAIGSLLMVGACDKRNDPSPVGTSTPSNNRADTVKPAPAPDNTARNKGDGAPEVKSPMDQSEAAADIKITADIRRAILDDKSMSTNAQNCKIITGKNGMVTLRGVVNTQAEKDSIDAKAKGIAGVTHVDNQLEVKMP